MSLNINNVNKKAVVIFSLFGFILSLIAGLFSGTAFITVLIKSLVSGLVIGVIITICNLVIMVYLPELLEKDDSIEESDEESDGQIDIVMPQEGYTVQKEDQYNGSEISEFGEGENTEDLSEESPRSSDFKEVDMSNLKDLSSVGVGDIKEDQEVSEEGVFGSSKTSDGEQIAGDHSVEEMAKAVKTVLKKD